MTTISTENKRIAKNTLLLYFRQIIVMVISLYTSRIVLSTLGVIDFGIYNLVGSIVIMFTFIRSSMGNATNRYIAYAIGKNDKDRLCTVFKTCLHVHWILAFIIVLLSEIVGIYMFCHGINIPTERLTAAFFAFQLSVVTCAINVICVPYDAEIIAHEKMSAFAYMSFVDVFLKLVAVYLLAVLPWDRLIIYSVLLASIQLIDRFIYRIYCKRNFEEVKSHAAVDKKLVKDMFGFAIWNLVGNAATISCAPVLNIILNAFFGPVVNAARGIAAQVQSAIKSFSSNFQLAVIPQITKSYARGNIERMVTLVLSSCRYSYFLLFILSFPIIMETEKILSLWLVNVPDHTVSFLRLVLIVLAIETMEQPLHVANLATGKIRFFQTIKGISLLTMLPLAYIALKMGFSAESVFVVQAIVTFISLFLQIKILDNLINISVLRFIKEVIIKSLIVTAVAFPLPLLVKSQLDNGLIASIFICLLSMLSAIISIYFVGINKNERNFINTKMKEEYNKIFNVCL